MRKNYTCKCGKIYPFTKTYRKHIKECSYHKVEKQQVYICAADGEEFRSTEGKVKRLGNLTYHKSCWDNLL